MKNYFVFVNYYISSISSPIDCDSILMTGYENCVHAWRGASDVFGEHVKNNGYSKFTISEFKEIE